MIRQGRTGECGLARLLRMAAKRLDIDVRA